MLKLQFKDQRTDPIWVVDKSFAIGSADDNQLVINDSSVSLQHARIVFSDNVYFLRDLGSAEGVYINNQRINKKPINNGDILRIGAVELVVINPFLEGNQSSWSLIACSSWLSGQEFPIPESAQFEPIKVGRSSHCDIIFPGTHLSREHVELRQEKDCLKIRDLNSANGTFINDHKVEEGELRPGDKLRLDVYSFKIFGPGLKPNSSQNTLSPPPEATALQKVIMPPNVRAQNKNWKTRPTSPGNRSNEPQIQNKNTLLVTIAAVLCIAVIGLGLYLTLG